MTIYCKDYDITDVIHETAVTTIFRGFRKVDHLPVILKLLKPECINDRSSKKIENEFNYLNKINAPQIIHAYELIPFQKTLLLVLEEFSARTLKHYLKEEPIDLKLLLEIAIDIAEGIGHIHKNNVIHKDIKPSNILINSERKVKIIDFGIGTSLAREVQQEIQPEQLEGTISYISPEQTARMSRPIDYRTDIYSFGVTLYELFTRELPFNANSPIELIHLHIAQKPISPSRINPDIPDIISDIILKCMEKNPDDRYKSAFGLKKDLEKCLDYLQALNNIPRFKLAQNDVYEKFHAPEKLYGREIELKIVEECLNEIWKGETRLMALIGRAGAGKSSLSEEIKKSVLQKNGYFFFVKYDQINEKIPYYGITSAFHELIHQILTRSNEVVAEWKTKILECVEGKGQILIDIIPDLKLIIGEQPPVDELSPIESDNRFKYIFGKFMRVLADAEHPLVLMFDNFQWGDEATIKLITNFLLNKEIQHLLVIISYRDNEVSPLHPIYIMQKELSDAHIELLKINILPLDLQPIESIIQEVFPGVNDRDLLCSIIKQKTFGNPFFVIQFLKYLYINELIQFDFKETKWVALIDKITSLEISDNVVELLVDKIQSLSPEVLELLKVCSVFGDKFDVALIAQVLGNDEKSTYKLLQIALEDEYLVHATDFSTEKMNTAIQSNEKYKFAHDRIRQLFYNQIKNDEKAQIHFQIGHILLNTLPENVIEDQIVSVVNHLNFGIDFNLDQLMRSQLLSLNLKAGLKIKNNQAFFQAIPYFKNAIHLLGPNCWTEQYNEAFALHENLGISLQLIGDINRSENHYDLCLKHAKTDFERVEIYKKIMFLASQMKDYDKEFKCAKKALDLLDFPMDLEPSFLSAVIQLARVTVKLKLRPIEQIKNLPLVTDHRLENILQIVDSLGHTSYVTGNQFLLMKLTLTLLELSLKYNQMSQDTGAAFLGYAVILGSEQLGDFKGCFKYGQIGKEIMDMCPVSVTALTGRLIYPYFVHRCKYPLKDSIELLYGAYRENMLMGGVSVAASCIAASLVIQMAVGDKLSNVHKNALDRISEFKKLTAVAETNIMLVVRDMCVSLLGMTSDPLSFCPVEFANEIYDKKEIKADRLYLLSYSIWHSIMLYLFDQYNEARDEFKELLLLVEKFAGVIEWPLVYLCYALSLAAPLKTKTDNPEDWKTLLRLHKTLSKWNADCPIRFEIFSLLVQGEVARIENNSTKVIQCFSQAIKKAKIEENYMLIGLGYELFARHYLKLGVTDLTVLFLEKAMYFYETWGAVAKCNHIRSLYGDYLSAHESPVGGNEFPIWSDDMTHQTTVSTMNYETISTISTTLSTFGGESSFDLGTIMEASETLSREIEFDRLVQSLMNLMIVNAGANKAFLIIYEDNKPFVYSEIYIGEPYVPLISPLPLEERSDEICIQIVEYVGRARNEVVLNNATERGPFYQDQYIQTKKPKSILCLPLIQNEILKGILYLENTETIKAFTQNHLRLLNLLSSQMAISIENAKFYTNLETKVKARTQELEEKNIELNHALKHIKETQNQLIQKEKLASLGVMTAGIAHELKNPLNFIINFAQIIKDNLKDLKDEIQSGNKEEKLIIVNEMIENLNVIDSHGQRSNSIIKGMLSHSHQGSKTFEDVDLNSLVDQAFGLAYYTFRKKEPTFNLKIEKSFEDNLPIIKGYPGDLLRVFINIIDNACYALFEKMKLSNDGYQPHMEAKTFQEAGYLVVKIKDNGSGIPQEYLNKVFNPFFTTKPAGSGTGLGLSIAYDIIVKEHSGKLEVISKAGEMTEFIIKFPYLET